MKRSIIMLLALLFTITGCGQEEHTGTPVSTVTNTIPCIVKEPTTEAPTEMTVSSTEAETTAETTEAEKYYQHYPVQDYQKAYAEFLDSLDYPNTPYVIHIDEDTIPELVVIKSLESADLYSFDGAEVYEAGTIGLDYYMYDFRYRPYLGMVSHCWGSVMYDNRQTIVQIFEKIDGRLQQVDEVHIAHSEFDLSILQDDAEMMGRDTEYLCGFEDSIPYDIGGEEESWISPDEFVVTDAQIAYWLSN